jgi:hypothetical protein
MRLSVCLTERLELSLQRSGAGACVEEAGSRSLDVAFTKPLQLPAEVRVNISSGRSAPELAEQEAGSLSPRTSVHRVAPRIGVAVSFKIEPADMSSSLDQSRRRPARSLAPYQEGQYCVWLRDSA